MPRAPRAPYAPPKLTVYGDVRQLTRQLGNMGNGPDTYGVIKSTGMGDTCSDVNKTGGDTAGDDCAGLGF
jgi:hypothetical protein